MGRGLPGEPRGGLGAVLPLALRTLPLCCQTEIAKRLNVICAQLIPFLSQEVGEPAGSVPAHRGTGSIPAPGRAGGAGFAPSPAETTPCGRWGPCPG